MSGMSGMSGMLGIPGITLTFGIQAKSSATSVAFFVSLPRRYSICTVSPGSSLRASCTRLVPGPDSSSSSVLSPASAVPLNLVMMSPTLSPAFAAGPPGVTPSIFAPSLSTWESGWVFTTTPIRPRLSSCKTKTPGGRGGRRGRCAARLAGQAASMAAAITIQVRCMIRCSFGASQPHVSGASDVDAHELLHELHALLPQCDEVGRTRLGLRGAQLRQLAVDDGNAVFQGGGERRGAAARHPPVGVVPLELLLQRRRLLFHSRQLGGVDGLRPERPEHEEPAGRRAGSAFSCATRWYSASSSAPHAPHPVACCRAHADPSPATSANKSSIVQCIIVRLLHRASPAAGRGRAPAAIWKNSPSCPSAPRSPRGCSPRHRAAIPPLVTCRSTARTPARDRSGRARRLGSFAPSPPPRTPRAALPSRAPGPAGSASGPSTWRSAGSNPTGTLPRGTA